MPAPLPIAVVIPALNPDDTLVRLVDSLTGFAAIIVVDDGSAAQYDAVFSRLRDVSIAHHAVNLGKGAALKTGFNQALLISPPVLGVVTADADGQHHPADILAVAQRLEQMPTALVMGARKFRRNAPWRSKLGNELTRFLFRLLLGQRLSDTQTGLRGIPRALLPQLLKLPSNGYDFELDMLIACKYGACPVVEQSIRTIYEPGNPSSHFNPLIDSMKIYFVLLRFSAISILTACLDNLIFYLAFTSTRHLLLSQICGRAVALGFNYAAVRKAVFLVRGRHRAILPKYLLLVVVSGLLSYGGIRFLVSQFGWEVFPAKIIAETALFFLNFTIQRDYIFTRRREEAAI